MGQARTILRGGVLLAALGLLATGAARTHKVYEGDGDFVVMVFERIPESRLVEYATYGGVYADEDGKLVRRAGLEPADGKQKCPT